MATHTYSSISYLAHFLSIAYHQYGKPFLVGQSHFTCPFCPQAWHSTFDMSLFFPPPPAPDMDVNFFSLTSSLDRSCSCFCRDTAPFIAVNGFPLASPCALRCAFPCAFRCALIIASTSAPISPSSLLSPLALLPLSLESSSKLSKPESRSAFALIEVEGFCIHVIISSGLYP